MRCFVIDGGRPLAGRVRVPGDKSISHRAALLGAMAHGTTEIRGFLRGEDCMSTLRCLRALGVAIDDDGETIRVHGRGLEGLRGPEGPLDVGNAGTLFRLLAGVVAGRPFATVLDGDASIRKRPMDRVAAPLRAMGARVEGLGERCLPPVRVEGGLLHPIEYTLPVASAQVKSCVLLAGCSAEGVTTAIEPAPTRDHTERMLAAFGATVRREGNRVSVDGPTALRGQPVEAPGDFSSAAFPLVAALLVPGSAIWADGVGVNPTRTGLSDLLGAMGARLARDHEHTTGGEPVADLRAEASALTGSLIEGSLVPRLIDEIPIAALCGCFAQGPLTVRDAGELRVKESDRIEAVARTLAAFGGRVETAPDGFTVHPSALHAAEVESDGDHRIAMTAAVAGLACPGTTIVRDTACVETSFPGFVPLLRSLGAAIREEER